MTLTGTGFASIHAMVIFFSGAYSFLATFETSNTNPILLFWQIDTVFMVKFMFSI